MKENKNNGIKTVLAVIIALIMTTTIFVPVISNIAGAENTENVNETNDNNESNTPTVTENNPEDAPLLPGMEGYKEELPPVPELPEEPNLTEPDIPEEYGIIGTEEEENAPTVYIDSPDYSVINGNIVNNTTVSEAESNPDIIMSDMGAYPLELPELVGVQLNPGDMRNLRYLFPKFMAFEDKHNALYVELKNVGNKSYIVKLDLYEINPDGNKTFLGTEHYGLIRPNSEKTRMEIWVPETGGRNYIYGEIYIMEVSGGFCHPNVNWTLINTFKKSFNVVPGDRPVRIITGDWTIDTPTVIESETVIVNGDMYVNAPLEIRNTTVFGDNLWVNDTYTIKAGATHDMALWNNSGEYKVQVKSNATLAVYGKLWNNPNDIYYNFYVYGNLTVDGIYGNGNGSISEVNGNLSDLSQPGGIIAKDAVGKIKILNGGTIYNCRAHALWLDDSEALIQDATIRDNGGDGIVAVNGAVVDVEGANVSWNGRYGIDVDGGILEMGEYNGKNNTISWNGLDGVHVENVIDAYGKPDYTPGVDLGYFIWYDSDGWHIRMSSDNESHDFNGTIIADGDTFTFNRTVAGGTEKILDIGEYNRVIFDLLIDDVRQPSLVFIGSQGLNPPYIPFMLSSNAGIRNSVIELNMGSGIYANKATISIENNTISDNGMALKFFDDVESGTDGWNATGLWHRVYNGTKINGTWNTPAWNISHSGDWSWWYGYEHNGTGDYNTTENGTATRNYGKLISPLINLTDAKSAYLTFWSWHEVEPEGSSHPHPESSNPIPGPGPTPSEYDVRYVAVGNESNYTLYEIKNDPEKEWTRITVNISDFAGREVYIAFVFDTVDNRYNDYQGWYVDDIKVVAAEPGIRTDGISAYGSTIYANNNTINSNNRYGIFLSICHGGVLYNNSIDGAGDYGLRLTSSSGNEIDNNHLHNLKGGISLFYSNTNTIINNIEESANSANRYSNIALQLSKYNTLRNNSISGGYSGIVLGHHSDFNMIESNNSISGSKWFGIYVYGSFNNTIRENSISENVRGVAISYYQNMGRNNTVKNNTFIDNYYGVYLYPNTNNNTIGGGNTFIDNMYGVYIYAARDNVVSHNSFSDNYSGIYIRNTEQQNSIFENTFTHSGNGVVLSNSKKTMVYNNTFLHNSVGTYIRNSAKYNHISENIFSSNGRSIYLEYCNDNNISYNEIYNASYGVLIFRSSANEIFHNTVRDSGFGISINLPSVMGPLDATSSMNVISYNNIQNNNLGAYLDVRSNVNTLENNTFYSNGKGIQLCVSSYQHILNNNFSGEGVGIYLDRSDNIAILGNTMKNEGIFISGRRSFMWDTHTIDTTNTVNGKPVYYWKFSDGGTIPSNAGEVILVETFNVTVENQNLSGTTVGMEMAFSSNTITNDTISSNNWYGIYSYKSSGNIYRNKISNNSHGIYISNTKGENAQICASSCNPQITGSEYSNDTVIVKLKPSSKNEQQNVINSIQNDLDVKSINRLENLDIYILKLGENTTVEEAIENLSENSEVLYAEPDYKVTLTSMPNDEYFPNKWGLHNTGQNGGTPDADIDAPEAWNITTGSKDVVIAIIDPTGVDYTHPDLADNMWTNPGEAGENATNGKDDDGDGYIDDVHGINAARPKSDPKAGDPFGIGHGTFCAGIAGAVGNNSIGVVGVNWNTSIMAIKMDSVSGAIRGIDYVIMMKERGINIVAISASWVASRSEALYEGIAEARDHGILFVSGAGNWATNNDWEATYPASYNLTNIISATATDNRDRLWGYSCYGQSSVDVGAPGVDVWSTGSGKYRQYYGHGSGTSYSAPYVAGLAALIESKNQSYNYINIKNLILNTVDKKPDLEGKILTGGRINAYNALAYVPSGLHMLVDNPPDRKVVYRNHAFDISVELSDGLNPILNATVTARMDGQTVTLHDDGIWPDQVAGDGYYAGRMFPHKIGFYRLNITASKDNLSISEGRNITVIGGCMCIDKNSMANNRYGVYIDGRSSRLFIEENTIHQSNYGIFMRTLCGSNLIFKNIIYNNTHGIYGGDGDTLSNNTLYSNTYGIYNGNRNRILNNSICNNIYGILSVGSSSHVSENIILNNTYGIYIKTEKNIYIGNNSILYNEYGITANNTEKPSSPPRNITITENRINSNTNGVSINISTYLTYETLLKISNNTISENNVDGIHFSMKCQNTWHSPLLIENNIIEGNSRNGIYSSMSTSSQYDDPYGVTIRYNLISRNKYSGIFVDHSYFADYNYLGPNTIVGNTITENMGAGIRIVSSSQVKISSNYIAYNGYGIYAYIDLGTLWEILMYNSTITRNSLGGIFVENHGTYDPSSGIGIWDSHIVNNPSMGVHILNTDSVIENNSITGNYEGIRMENSSGSIDRNIISGNNPPYSPPPLEMDTGIKLIKCNNVQIYENYMGENTFDIYSISSRNILVENNEITESTVVIQIYPSSPPSRGIQAIESEITVKDNRFYGCIYGIYLKNIGQNSIVKNNSFYPYPTGSSSPIYLKNASATVEWNNISAAEGYGIYCSSNSNAKIENNTINSTYDAIHSVWSSPLIRNNTVSSLWGWGIYSAHRAPENAGSNGTKLVSENTFGNCSEGWAVQYWNLQIRVLDNGSPVENASVKIYNHLGGQPVWDGYTDENGYTELLLLPQYAYNSTGAKTQYSPYTVIINGNMAAQTLHLESNVLLTYDTATSETTVTTY